MRDYKIELENRIKFIQNKLAESHANGIVFGNSGGKDSALVGILCKMACDDTVGIMMPCSSKVNFGSDLDDGNAVAKQFDIENELNTLQKKLENDYSEKLINKFSRLHDEFERLGGYSYKSELASIISSFGFSETDKKKKLCEFSGGQKTKIAFIKLILSKPDVLLLDEPTNNLDIKAVNWLEDYIASYKKAVIIVSHDRTFLDNTINVVYEIEHKKLIRYTGNYSKFLKTKEENYEARLKMYEAQQREIADITAFIERFRYKATKAAAVQSRVKMLEKMEIIQKPERSDNRAFQSKIKPEKESGSEVLSCSNLRIGYQKDEPLANI